MTYTFDFTRHTVTCDDQGLQLTIDTQTRQFVAGKLTMGTHNPGYALDVTAPPDSALPQIIDTYTVTTQIWNDLVNQCSAITPPASLRPRSLAG